MAGVVSLLKRELGLFKFNDEDMKMENVDNLKTDAESVFTAPQERRYILNIIDKLAKCSEFIDILTALKRR